MKWAIFDAEGNGLNPDKFHCLSFTSDTDESTLVNHEQMKAFLSGKEVLIGHNIILWDIPNLERVLDVKFNGIAIDTLALSWYIYNERDKHGLESWGEELGIKKPEIDNWHDLSLEEYVHRCEQDREITKLLWGKQVKYLKLLYPNPKDFWNFIQYIHEKFRVVASQENSKWKLDVEYCKEHLSELETIKEEKINVLRALMPPVPIIAKRVKPKVLRKKDGSLSSHGLVWYSLLKENKLPEDYDGVIDVQTGLAEPNPSSSSQIKSWLYSLGWIPRTFKYKDGREIPQINKERGEGLCDSIKELFDEIPDLDVLDSLSVISHRIGILKGFLSDVDENGYLKATIAGLTNTLRFKHSEIVNLPKINTKYAEGIRNSLIASDDDHELCGSDQKSLEDRLKQHFIYPFDPEYVKEMMKDDFDPHLDLAHTAKKLSDEDVIRYKEGDKSKKKIRDIFKNGNYACQYGAGPPRLEITCGINREEAIELHKAYWERNQAIKEVVKQQKVKTLNGQMWLLNPINKFYYPLRERKDIFSTLVQGTASYVFDLWAIEINKVKKLTAQFHDELVLNVKKGYRKEVTEFLQKAIKTVNDKVKLNRQLEIDIQFGNRYGEIH